MQLQRDVGIFGGIGRGRFQIDLVECQLLGAFAGNVLVMNRLLAEVLACHRIHVMTRGDAVEHVGFEHRIEGHAAQRDVVAGQNVRVVFEVMADFLSGRHSQARS